MAEYSKYNIVYRLQKWMDSVPGQTFLNYAYSWGASIVIFGTLCKLTHLPGANFWLFLGMGTEVFVFFISAFDRRDYRWLGSDSCGWRRGCGSTRRRCQPTRRSC